MSETALQNKKYKQVTLNILSDEDNEEINSLINNINNLNINNTMNNMSIIDGVSDINLKKTAPEPLDFNVLKIQKWFRGCILRLKQLPLIMYKMQRYLQSKTFEFSSQNNDGRINSCIDEDGVIKLLFERFGDKIKIPKIRMWYDILAYDYTYGWIPINIKTSTMKTSDNLGNLTTSVYAYTDEQLDLYSSKTYENGKMSIILFDKLKAKKYNPATRKHETFVEKKLPPHSK